MKWNIGCSGFSYKDWIGFFYPEDLKNTQWLEYYATYFNTLELNSTFYKLPGLIFFKNLFRRTPADFCFVIKAPKLITHIHQFTNCEALITDFYEVVQNGLMEKLGAVLFQLPPSFSFTQQRLEIILNSMDNSILNVIEFRHKSWWNEMVYTALSDKKITFCGTSFPGLPDAVIINSDTPYYRFHGVPTLYYSMYSEAFLKNVAGSFLNKDELKQGFFLFNNTATRAALENASFMQEYISL